MKTVLFSSLAAGSLLIAAGAAQASDSWSVTAGKSASQAMGLIANGAKPGKPHMGGGNWNGPKPSMPHVGGGNWNSPKPPMNGGNWHGPRPGTPNVSWHPRPGYHGIPKNDVYRRPFRGFNLAAYWIQPSFYIPNYTIYGLSAPSNGYYWSRYYDDAVLINNRGTVADYRNGINWDGYPPTYNAPQYQQAQYGPAIRPDAQAYEWGGQDGPVYSDDWQDGGYEDENAYYEEAGYAPGAPYGGPAYGNAPGYAPPAPYRVPAGYEGYEKCLKSNGLTGAAIGAVIGGVAGNQIAGRGDKLFGTLFGAGIGGITGAVIEKAVSKCKSRAPQYRPAPPQVSYPPQGYGPPPPAPYPPAYSPQYQYQSGYYYAQPQVTVTVVPGYTTTSTVTTEEYVYETVSVPAKKRYVAKKKWKPKPKVTCVCR